MPRLSNSTINNIVYILECDWSPTLIAAIYKYSKRTVFRIKTNLDI